MLDTVLQKCWGDGKLPIITGGSGMYLKSFINGIAYILEVSQNVKLKIEKIFMQKSKSDIHEILAKIGIKSAAKYKPCNTYRIKRALEVYFEIGKSITQWQESTYS